MTTLERLKEHAQNIADKIRRGEQVTKDELKILEIYNRQTSTGKAGNAGKRKGSKNIQKP